MSWSMMSNSLAPTVVVGTIAAVVLGYHLYRRRPQRECECECEPSGPDKDLEVPFSELHRLREMIDREGVAIVTGVLNSNELKALEQEFKDELTSLVDEDAVHACDDPRVKAAYERFQREGLPSFPYATAKALQPIPGFVMNACVCAGQFAWRLRTHPRVHAAFGALFPGSGQLVSSIDVTFFQPEREPPAATPDAPTDAHVDQNGHDVRAPALGTCDIYQGVVYVWGAEEGCSTTCVWPGSHRSVWPRMMADPSFVAPGKGGDHYSQLVSIGDDELRTELLDGWRAHHRRLRIPAGSLLLWNSRTVHTGWMGGRRLAQTVCLEPARERPAEQRLGKLRLAALGIPGTHWARIAHQHDVLPRARGWLSKTPVCKAKGADTHCKVRLPLRPAIRPAPLADAADLAALAEIVHVDWNDESQRSSHCVWKPPPSCAPLLEVSVREEFKRFL